VSTLTASMSPRLISPSLVTHARIRMTALPLILAAILYSLLTLALEDMEFLLVPFQAEVQLRIKTVYGATDASVTNVVYKDNKVSGISTYGIVIEQDYKNGRPFGTPTNGVTLGPVTFSGTNTVEVGSGASRVYVLCGKLCTGSWDWAGLTTSGGKVGSSNYNDINGYYV